jgi:uncharacterized protein YigA (DUF484 family)
MRKFFLLQLLFILFCLSDVNAAWNEHQKTENFLKQLNETTEKLVGVAKTNSELSQRILELTESNIKSSESMELITKQIKWLTIVLVIFAIFQLSFEVFNVITNRKNIQKKR